jgi:ADP-ribose pyrophosphatase YjhB (NUDIX family)
MVLLVAMFDGWKVCPRCSSQLMHGAEVVQCAACGFFLYAHSAVTASALPEDGQGRVLLARRANDPWRDRWDLVGGFLSEGEHPLDGLRREVLEETGLEFEPGRFLGVWMGDYDGRATLNPIWTGRIEQGELRAADDVAELRWFAADALPEPAELAFDGLVAEILGAWRNEHA